MKSKQLVFALSILICLPAGAEPLKVKPGLWETTTISEKKGARKPSNLDQLSPDQRAKVERKLTEKVKRESRSSQSCLRQAQIDSGEAFTGGNHHGACKRSFEKQTASEQVAHIVCDGVNPMSGKVTMRAPDPEHMSGTIEITYGASDQLQLLSLSEVTARWLGGDCGHRPSDVPINPHGHGKVHP